MTDTFRKIIRPLTGLETDYLLAIKNQAMVMEADLDKFRNFPAYDTEQSSERGRCLAIAKTKIEEAVMWAVKGISA